MTVGGQRSRSHRSKHQTAQIITHLPGLLCSSWCLSAVCGAAVEFSLGVWEVLRSYSGMKRLPFCTDS